MSLFRRPRPALTSFALRDWTPRIVEVLLRMPAWLRLSKSEAALLAGYMEIQFVPSGLVFIRQDDPSQTDGMMLLLDGEVSVEKSASQTSDSLVVSIAQPGALLGEMGILNDAPRSASCVAYTDAVLALLTRDALERLVTEFPQVAAKLALGIASRLAERLRSTSSKLSTLSQVTAAMHPTLDASTLAGGLKRSKTRKG
ncbi:MAG: cyclic nucleotide-binding domain-containing protein [Betaproteobacteria bacterium]|uniref:Putative cAMP-binding protein n=1 Tax=Thiomonas delicata TaxID=364030 RepID=A0A238D1E4_THIDL|nr:cyclic nucleotide-binding domain-containing protein [Thiomonas delicata]MDE2128555.1 cyclic nucleotide-binding domain-containing protein [Betaproteobacteria bacterium]SBP87088.1 putative cAMP-binding protein [Thiomonas delicata]